MSSWQRWSRWLDYPRSASWLMDCFKPDANAVVEAELTAALAEEMILEIEREVFEILN